MGALLVLNRKPALTAAEAPDQVDESPKAPEEDGRVGFRGFQSSGMSSE